MTPSSSGTPSLLVVATIGPTHGFLLPFARHFRERGWRVDGCARGISQYRPAADAYDDLIDLPLSRSITDFRGIAGSITALRATVGRGYDVVHVHTPIAAFLTRAVVRATPRKRRPKVVYTAHGFHFYDGGQQLANSAFVLAERVAGRWTDRLVVINREDYAAAQRHKIVPIRRLRHMHGIGVDTSWYARAAVTASETVEALKGIGMDLEHPYFVTVGEFNRNKRPEDVVHALARMRDRQTRLLFLGDGPTRAKLEDVVTETGVADRVFMPGRVDDVRPFVSGSIALVQASAREGLPRSTMEALSMEVPVIATTARGQTELIDADRGILVPIGGISEMAAAMDGLAHDPAERDAMGARGRRLMVERYDIKLIIEEHERLYSGLLSPVAATETPGPARDG